MNDCQLCNEFIDNVTSPNIKDFFEDSRIFACNESLCVFPTVGCFVKGYILLATIKHYISLYNCPDDVVAEIGQTIKIIRSNIEEKFNSGMVFFEHGTVENYNLSPASVCHFHMHFMPVNESIWNDINNKYHFKYYRISDLSNVKELVNKNKIIAYLLFGDYDHQMYLIDCSEETFPSQFFRKVMYEYYYGDAPQNEWDWKQFPCYDLMAETMNMLCGMEI